MAEFDEVTSQITVNLLQADCLLLALTDAIKNTKEREAYFNTLCSDNHARIKAMKEFEIDEDELDRKIEEQLNLCDSLMDTYPSIFEAIKEIYPELEKKETDQKRIIIVSPSWRGQ